VPNLSSQEDQEIKEKISKACVYIHTSLTEATRRYLAEHKRHVYVTPSCYIDLLRTFGKIFETKTNEYAASVTRLRSGLESLSEANRLVAEMKADLIVLGPQLEAKARETEELLVKLGRDRAAVNEVRSIVAAEEEKMRTETDLVGQYANEAEKDLADVKPLLAAARESLNALNKADISEVR
jgi:dynein heavy chain